MKIRISEQMIRFRFNQRDTALLRLNHAIDLPLHWGPTANDTTTFRLKLISGSEAHVQHINHLNLQVCLPLDKCETWLNDESMESLNISINTVKQSLLILLERDLGCKQHV